jgi:hypothetical protein
MQGASDNAISDSGKTLRVKIVETLTSEREPYKVTVLEFLDSLAAASQGVVLL